MGYHNTVTCFGQEFRGIEHEKTANQTLDARPRYDRDASECAGLPDMGGLLMSIQDTFPEMGRAALEYAERGWKIFPCRADQKNPITEKGHKDATNDLDQVKKWWTETPTANIGLACAASGIVVVDPDTYKPTCDWDQFCVEKGIDEINTLTQRSARGGWHYFFAAQADAKYPGTLAREVDVKHNGYIMLAPSVFEGNAYAWHNDHGIADAPDWIKAKAPVRSVATITPQVDGITIADVSGPMFVEQTRIDKALAAIPAAELDYIDWVKVGMGLCHETRGDESGLALWDQWSRQDPRKDRHGYPGIEVLTKHWDSFTAGSDNPITMRTVFEMAKARKPDYLLPDWAAGWVYNETLMEFHQLASGHSIKSGAFNAKFSREPECSAAECTASALVLRYMRTVANTMFWPCDDQIIGHRGLDYVNVFQRHDVTPVAPMTLDAELAVQIIVDHAFSLATDPAEAELLLTFLAYVYQNPGKRVRWAIVLFGIQGNGKSFWVELMKRLMGHNAGEVAGTTVSQRFTGWAVNKLFIAIEEIRVPSESKYAVLDKLKPFITNDEVNVELKGQDDRVVPNFASYLLLTNHDDALPLDDDDRRYCVIETRHRTKADIPGQAYFDALFGALNDHIGAIAHYFATRPIPADFNPNGRAPETRGKHRMMQESKSGPRLAVEDAIAQFDCEVINGDVVYVGALLEQSQTWITGPPLPDRRSVGRILKEMGYIKHTVGDRHQGPKIGKKERAIYYRPDRTLPSDFMPILTQTITGCPF
jgi:hypothetical protein